MPGAGAAVGGSLSLAPQTLSALSSDRVSEREWSFCACSVRTRTLGTAPRAGTDVTSGDGGGGGGCGYGSLASLVQVCGLLPPPRGASVSSAA